MPETNSSDDMEDRIERLRDLFWIADAPLFIDERLVGRFYDAVVRPKFEHVSSDSAEEELTEQNLAGKLGISGELGLSLPEFLKPLKAGLKAEGAISLDEKHKESSTTKNQLKYIWNSERKLEELARHYLAHHPNRIVTARGVLKEDPTQASKKWYQLDQNFYTNVPRPVAFFDLSPKTILIPTAAEFADGSVILLFEKLAQRLTSELGGPTRKYPDDDDGSDTVETLKERRKKYWATYREYFNSKEAMIVIEEASSKHGRINWIDFRLPLTDEGDTLHLHIVPAGTADAGIFAYNFVRRAFRHGVRIVGTLKSEPDMNVMAIYDR